MSNTQEPIFSEEQQHYSHIIATKNHFGFSQEEDEFVKSSDFITVPYYEHQDPVYHYEKTDKARTLQNIIDNFVRLSQRLKTETNTSKIKRIKEIIKNDKDCILRDKEYIEKQMKLKVAQILSEHTL